MPTYQFPPAQQILDNLQAKLQPQLPGDQFEEFAAIVAVHLGDQEPLPEGLVYLLTLSVQEFINSRYPEVFRGILYNSMDDIIRAVVPDNVEFQGVAIAHFQALSAKVRTSGK